MKSVLALMMMTLIGIGTIITPINASQTTITLGKASDKVEKQFKRLNPIITYLASRLKDMGIQDGRILIESHNNNEKIIEYIHSGELDLIFETPFAVAHLMKKTGVIPILSISRQKVLQYQSYIFVRKDMGIDTIEDLKGKVIVFEDATSTSAFYLPKMEFEMKGMELVHLLNPNVGVPSDKIGYVFAGSELSISSWVYFKKVAAGAFSDVDWVSQDENPKAFRNQFKIIQKSPFVPRMFVLVRKSMNKKMIQRIKAELKSMHTHDAGKKALKKYKIDFFKEIEPEQLEVLNTIIKYGSITKP